MQSNTELVKKINEEVEQDRKNYCRIKEKISNEAKLSESEKSDFCTMIKVGSYETATLDDYSFCEEYKFLDLYRTYCKDLSGGGTYYKYSHQKALNAIRHKGIIVKENSTDEPFDFDFLPGSDTHVRVEYSEVEKDIAYLEKVADDWEVNITRRNHSDELLKGIAAEFGNHLRSLDKANKKKPSLQEAADV